MVNNKDWFDGTKWQKDQRIPYCPAWCSTTVPPVLGICTNWIRTLFFCFFFFFFFFFALVVVGRGGIILEWRSTIGLEVVVVVILLLVVSPNNVRVADCGIIIFHSFSLLYSIDAHINKLMVPRKPRTITILLLDDDHHHNHHRRGLGRFFLPVAALLVLLLGGGDDVRPDHVVLVVVGSPKCRRLLRSSCCGCWSDGTTIAIVWVDPWMDVKPMS